MRLTHRTFMLGLVAVAAVISSDTAFGNGSPRPEERGQPQASEKEGEVDLTLSQWPPRRGAAKRMDAHYILDIDDPHLKDKKTLLREDSDKLYKLDPNATSRVGDLTTTGGDNRLKIVPDGQPRKAQDARFSGTNCVGLDDVMKDEIQALVKRCDPDSKHPGAKRFISKINENGTVECRTLVCPEACPCGTPGCRPCLPYHCLGTPPANAILCINDGDRHDQDDLSQDTPFSKVTACTEAKCEYKMPGGGCPAGGCLCQGTVPEGYLHCKDAGDPADETDVPSGTTFQLVSACTSTKCEYKFSEGEERCQPGTPGCPQQCDMAACQAEAAKCHYCTCDSNCHLNCDQLDCEVEIHWHADCESCPGKSSDPETISRCSGTCSWFIETRWPVGTEHTKCCPPGGESRLPQDGENLAVCGAPLNVSLVTLCGFPTTVGGVSERCPSCPEDGPVCGPGEPPNPKDYTITIQR